MSNKTRLDVLLTERGLAESRQKAQAVIMAGHVFVAGQRVDKPGTAVLSDAPIEVRGHALPYVSRGGLKLEKAMKTFPITLTDKICADIGASTGGFTDCMLQNGARKVYSVDVGYGQLDWKLRSDPRVVCMERTNARYLTPEQIPTMMNYTTLLKADSMYNTPPCWCIYMTGLVMQYLENEIGGLENMQKINAAKAKVLYDYLDGQDFYNNPVEKPYRSMMNVTFTSPNGDLDKAFCAAATEAGFVNLKGHRLVGGMRASIYNAMPPEGIDKLVDFMEKFRKENA